MPKTNPNYKSVTVYTDGACKGNPGPGGYGCVLLCGDQRKELSGGFAETTNNRMEIIAAIRALEHLKRPCNVELYTDSQYLVNTMTKGWAKRWRERDWMRTADEPAKNADLWTQLLDLCEKHPTNFIWVKGHASNQENNHCDELAVAASHRSDLPPDDGYLIALQEERRRQPKIEISELKMTEEEPPQQGFLSLGF